MQKVVLITADNMAGILFTNILLKKSIGVSKIYLVDSIRGSWGEKLNRALTLLTKKSLCFLVYKLLIEKFAFKYVVAPKNGLISFEKIKGTYGVEIYTLKDVNSLSFKNQMANLDSETLVISGYGSQIFDRDIVTNLKNFWNIHGSYLPYFKGAAPYFWMRLNDNYPRGVTLHKVDIKLDSGEIIGQKTVNPSDLDSVFSYHLKCIQQAAYLTADSINTSLNISKDKPTIQGDGNYGGIPTPTDIRSLWSKGLSFFKLRDFNKGAIEL